MTISLTGCNATYVLCEAISDDKRDWLVLIPGKPFGPGRPVQPSRPGPPGRPWGPGDPGKPVKPWNPGPPGPPGDPDPPTPHTSTQYYIVCVLLANSHKRLQICSNAFSIQIPSQQIAIPIPIHLPNTNRRLFVPISVEFSNQVPVAYTMKIPECHNS